MENFKKIKLKSIIKKSNSSNLSQEKKVILNEANKITAEQVILNSSNENMNCYLREKENRKNDHCSPLNNPDVAKDILDSIEKVYFTSGKYHETSSTMSKNESENENDINNFDPENFVLEKLPEQLTVEYLLDEQQKYKRQLVVVSRKVSELILKNQPSYAQELERVTQLLSDLSQAIQVCTKARQCLDRSKVNFTCSSLGIVASYRRREILIGLLRSLKKIKTLQETDIRLRELLDQEDYSGAIHLYFECLEVVKSLKHFNCISELSNKLQDTLEMTEEQIDVALSKMCLSFNIPLYIKLQNAYQLLGKTQTAMDQLLMHFASAIHNKAFSIVFGYVELFCSSSSSSNEQKIDNFHKKQYSELCSFLTAEGFVPCFTDLCKALYDIMLNYYKILNWHREEEFNDENDDSVSQTNDKRYIKQKLEHGLGRVWQDVQQKIRVLIQNHDLSCYNFEEFIKILAIAEKMVEIGEDFCGSKSDELQDLIHKQTINYFHNYHRSCMYELKMFLESETWTLCPLAPGFSLLDLQEFLFLKSKPKISFIKSSPTNSPSRSFSYFSKFLLNQKDTLINPFDLDLENQENIETISNDAMDQPKLSSSVPMKSFDKRKSITEDSNNKLPLVLNGSSDSCLIMTTATLNALRLFGKYMHVMNILSPISFDVLLCIFQVFDYYIYSIYKFFGKDMLMMADNSISNQMRSSLKRISDNLIVNETNMNDANLNPKNKYLSPSLSPAVGMSNPEKLYGLAERIIAVESLIVLANQFRCLENKLEDLIPSDKKSVLEQYFNQVVLISSDLRKPIYMWVSVKSIQYENIVSLMSQVKWDIKEILSLHNNYVDLLLRELQIFSMRLAEVCNNQLKEISVPKEVNDLLWENVLRLANRTFIEGFSQAKKCSNEGRALMQLDYQQFLIKVESMTSIRPIPERELVEEYIKAYYLTEPALVQWIKTRKEYNPKQLIALVNSMTSDNKKLRSRLINVIETEFSLK